MDLTRLIARVDVDTENTTRVGDIEIYVYERGNRVLSFRDGADGPSTVEITTRAFYAANGQVYTVDARPANDGLKTHWLTVDRQGNVRDSYRFTLNTDGIVEENGYKFARFDYADWGEPQPVIEQGDLQGLFGVTAAFLQRFENGIYDADLQAFKFGDRWLSTSLHRWLSEDPSGLAFGTNPYEALNSSPYNYRDDSGHFAVPAIWWFVTAAAGYLGWTTLNASTDTGVEAGFTRAIGGAEEYAQFSYRETFVKNWAVNFLTGGIGGKGKLIYRVGGYVLRQGVEISGDTAYDVYKGRDLRESLLRNSVGSVLGEAGALLIKKGGRAFFDAYPRRNPFNYRYSFDTRGVTAPTGPMPPIRADYSPGEWKFMTRGKGFDRQRLVTGNAVRVHNGQRQINEYLLDTHHFDGFDIKGGVLREVKDNYDFAFGPKGMQSWNNGQRIFEAWAKKEQNIALEALDIAKRHGFTYEYLVDPRQLQNWLDVLDVAVQDGLIVKAW